MNSTSLQTRRRKRIILLLLFFFSSVPFQLIRCDVNENSVEKSVDTTVLNCPKSGKIISLDMINDGHCDCPEDGFDEPDTAACKNGRFYCKHSKGMSTGEQISIPSFMVNDGVCDCCDGSDEYLNNFGVNCPNTCDEIERSKKREKLIQSLKLKKAAKNANEMKQDSVAKRKEFEAKLIEIRAKIEEMNKNLDEKKAVNNISATKKSDTTSSTLESLLVEYREKIDELERLIADLKPALESENDEVEEEQIEAEAEAETDQHEEEEQEIEQLEPKPKPSSWKSKLLRRAKAFVPNMVNSPYTATITKYLPTIVPKTILQHEPERIYYEDQVKDLDNEVKELETQALELEEDLNSLGKYGPDSIFFSLKNACFSKESEEFEYTLCWFKSVEQRSKSSNISNNLGKWSRWEMSSSSSSSNEEKINNNKIDHYKEMVYDGGNRCGSKARETRVHLECGWRNEILSVSEPSMCSYVIHFSTPAVCKFFYVDLKSLVSK